MNDNVNEQDQDLDLDLAGGEKLSTEKKSNSKLIIMAGVAVLFTKFVME